MEAPAVFEKARFTRRHVRLASSVVRPMRGQTRIAKLSRIRFVGQNFVTRLGSGPMLSSIDRLIGQ